MIKRRPISSIIAKKGTIPYYGFHGKEKDTEGMGGGGTTYDYGFRIYNPQIAKFLSVDPLTKSYPWYTPYQFAGNMPIFAVDLDGLEELPALSQFMEKVGVGVAYLEISSSAEVGIPFLGIQGGKSMALAIDSKGNYSISSAEFGNAEFFGFHSGGSVTTTGEFTLGADINFASLHVGIVDGGDVGGLSGTSKNTNVDLIVFDWGASDVAGNTGYFFGGGLSLGLSVGNTETQTVSQILFTNQDLISFRSTTAHVLELLKDKENYPEGRLSVEHFSTDEGKGTEVFLRMTNTWNVDGEVFDTYEDFSTGVIFEQKKLENGTNQVKSKTVNIKI